MKVLVTGATGYIGSRLVPRLLEDDHEVVAATRSGSVRKFAWSDQVEVAAFDVEDEPSIRAAVRGVDAVIYLIHSMDSGEDFIEKDRKAAERVADAAYASHVQRMVYLSGLIPDTDDLSDHLRSRLQVERVLLDSATPTTVLRAAMVVGAGSTSFELMARMTDRMPFTPIPMWMRSQIQPIAVSDVIDLIAASLTGEPQNRHYDVGGPEQLSYPDLLASYAKEAGKHRIQVPVLWAPQRLVGLIVSLVAQMSRTEVTALVESLSHDMVCGDDDVMRELMPPGHRFLDVRESIRRSLKPEDDATSAGADPQVSDPADA